MRIIIGTGIGLLVMILGFYLNARKAKAKIKEIIQPKPLEVTGDNINEILDTQYDCMFGGGPAHPCYVARKKGLIE